MMMDINMQMSNLSQLKYLYGCWVCVQFKSGTDHFWAASINDRIAVGRKSQDERSNRSTASFADCGIALVPSHCIDDCLHSTSTYHFHLHSVTASQRFHHNQQTPNQNLRHLFTSLPINAAIPVWNAHSLPWCLSSKGPWGMPLTVRLSVASASCKPG